VRATHPGRGRFKRRKTLYDIHYKGLRNFHSWMHCVQKTDRAILLEMLYTRSWLQVRGAEVAQPGSTRKWEAKESTRCPIWAGEAEDLSGLIPG
jgi:hypothetical protein